MPILRLSRRSPQENPYRIRKSAQPGTVCHGAPPSENRISVSLRKSAQPCCESTTAGHGWTCRRCGSTDRVAMLKGPEAEDFWWLSESTRVHRGTTYRAKPDRDFSNIRLEPLACSTTQMVSNDELVAGQPRSYARCSPRVVARTLVRPEHGRREDRANSNAEELWTMTDRSKPLSAGLANRLRSLDVCIGAAAAMRVVHRQAEN